MQPETPNADNVPKPTDATEPVTPMPVGTSITPDTNVAQNILDGQQVVEPAVVTEQPQPQIPDEHVANNIMGVVTNPQVTGPESQVPVPPQVSTPDVSPTTTVVSSPDGQQPMGMVGNTSSVLTKKSKTPLIIGGIAALIVLLGAGYTFGLYLPAQPSNVYKTGLSRSGKAADALVKYGTSQQSLLQKQGAKFDIQASVKSSGASFDLAAKGAYDVNANVDTQITADIMGSKLSANVRSISSGKGATPDIY
ncbi:MAG: hypothetical protein ACREGB_02720, partial [Candidatus Saccharimonadales bacterium]